LFVPERSVMAEECLSYVLEPCPTLEELRNG
jgi:hypothetical protein